MTAGRVYHATLDLLDRQLRDRDGRLCGKVDDLEIERSADTGELFVTAIVCGPGMLLQRTGHRRLGRWLQRTAHLASVPGPSTDPAVVPIELAHGIGAVIDVAVTADDLATAGSERWVRDHIIGHIPGNRHRAPQ
jgi:hypothetical protein